MISPPKPFVLAALLLLLTGAASGQAWNGKMEAGGYFGTIQYNGELGNQFLATDNLQSAFGVSISQYLSEQISLGLLFIYGKVEVRQDKKELTGDLSSMNLFLRFYFLSGKLIKSNARIAPFLTAGFGGAEWEMSRPEVNHLTDAFVPAGAGIRFRIGSSIALLLQSQFHFSMTDSYDRSGQEKGNDHFLVTMAGLTYNFHSVKDADGDRVVDRKDRCPGTPRGVRVDPTGCPVDKDGDGVADYIDVCPDLPGTASASGCPDMDGDALRDEEDRCPELKGVHYLAGCPDADGDSIPDAEDRCPELKGIAALNGCPDHDEDMVADDLDDCPDEKGLVSLRGCPDRDGDAIPDKDDRCPDESGIAANKGCPEIKEEVKRVFERALTGIQFESGSARIKGSSFSVLDEIVSIMKDHPEYHLTINGHTDNTGTPDKNLELSMRRAAASREYLISKGIEDSRITSNGYGDTLPVADNGTKEGRLANRRVEFKVVF